jgi:hypothetical protein
MSKEVTIVLSILTIGAAIIIVAVVQIVIERIKDNKAIDIARIAAYHRASTYKMRREV